MTISLEPEAPRSFALDHLRGQIAATVGALVLETLTPRGDEQLVDALFEHHQKSALADEISKLDSHERRFVEERFHNAKTLVETAIALSMSPRSVQRLEKKVTERLGMQLRALGLAPA